MNRYIAAFVLSFVSVVFGLNLPAFNTPPRQIKIELTDLPRRTAAELIKSTVLIKLDNGSSCGSGFIVYRIKHEGKNHNLALTCAHVIGSAKTIKCSQIIYAKDRDMRVITENEAKVIAQDSIKDLCLLDIITPGFYSNMVELATDSEYEEMSLYDHVVTVGCPLGYPPSITKGNISCFNLNNHLMITAPLIYGNSGGGIYNMDGKVIGIARRVVMFGDPVGFGHPYPNIGLGVTLPDIKKFLSDTGYGFIYGAKDGSAFGRPMEKTKARPSSSKTIDELLRELMEDH